MKNRKASKVIIWFDVFDEDDDYQYLAEVSNITKGNPWHCANRLIESFMRSLKPSEFCAVDSARVERV